MIDTGFLFDDDHKILMDWILSDNGELSFSLFHGVSQDKMPSEIDLNDFSTPIPNEYKSFITKITVPEGIEKITDSRQTEMHKGVFEDYISLKDFVIKGDSFLLDDCTFKNCYSLENIENMEAIHGNIFSRAFMNCTSLKKASFGVIFGIDHNAFENCVNLEKMDFSTSFEIGINKEAFLNCNKLESIDLSSVSMIGERAFKNCISLKSADLVCNFADVESFQNCFNLDNVVFEQNCKNIYDSAFENCSNLSSVTFKENAPDNIHEKAFSKCSHLSDIDISSTDNIGKDAFQMCKKLETVHFRNGVSVGDSAFFASGLKNVEIPESFYPEDSTFMCCRNLKDIKMPEKWAENSDKVITAGQFSNTAIEDIKIPENTESIGVDAFCNTNLSHIFIPDKVQEVAYMAVDRCGKLMSMSVSKETKMPDIVGTDLSEYFAIEERFPSVIDKMNDFGKDIKTKDVHQYAEPFKGDKSDPDGR